MKYRIVSINPVTKSEAVIAEFYDFDNAADFLDQQIYDTAKYIYHMEIADMNKRDGTDIETLSVKERMQLREKAKKQAKTLFLIEGVTDAE